MRFTRILLCLSITEYREELDFDFQPSPDPRAPVNRVGDAGTMLWEKGKNGPNSATKFLFQVQPATKHCYAFPRLPDF
jgi:hypothetical protein